MMEDEEIVVVKSQHECFHHDNFTGKSWIQREQGPDRTSWWRCRECRQIWTDDV